MSSFLGSPRLYYTGRYPYSQGMVGHIVLHYGIRSNYCPATDMHARSNNDILTKPGSVVDDDLTNTSDALTK